VNKKQSKLILIAAIVLLVAGCGSTTSTSSEPIQITPPTTPSDQQEKEFAKANALDKAGENSLANEIWGELAKQGHVPSLRLYAVKQYNQYGTPVYYAASDSKGCQRKIDSGMVFDGVPVHSFRTNFAIKKLAEQGDLQAANVHFECEVGRFKDKRGVPPTNAISVIKYAAEKQDLRALNNLVDFELSYYARADQYRYDRANMILKKYRFRPIEIENASQWAKKSFQIASIDTNLIPREIIHKVIEAQVKVAGTYQYHLDNFKDASTFYNNAKKLCYSKNAHWPERKGQNFSIDSICEVAKNRSDALKMLSE
jgi:hypothetical protein